MSDTYNKLLNVKVVTAADVDYPVFERLNKVKDLARSYGGDVAGVWVVPMSDEETTMIIKSELSIDDRIALFGKIGKIFNYELSDDDNYAIFDYNEDVVKRGMIPQTILDKALRVYTR